jgi:protein SCO1/2
LFFFGYTHCPDVCPLTLAQFVRVRQSLGAASEQIDMYFVTLDPARDTPERMRQYMSSFPGVTGLMGTDSELASAQSTFAVVAERRDLGGGDYALDHTAATYLVNRQGSLQLAYPYGTDANDIIADLRQLLAAPTDPPPA